MKLSVHKRETGKKGVINQLRREGNIPAILYGNKEAGAPVYVKAEEVQSVLRNLKQPGLLATTVFELQEGSHKYKAVIKDIQYHVASYDIVHLDFAILSDDKPVTVNVPIHLVGVVDCVGVKLGGFIRQPIRTVKISCLPKHIPQEFKLDVSAMNVGESKTLAEVVTLSSHLRALSKMSEVAIVIGKKAGSA